MLALNGRTRRLASFGCPTANLETRRESTTRCDTGRAVIRTRRSFDQGSGCNRNPILEDMRNSADPRVSSRINVVARAAVCLLTAASAFLLHAVLLETTGWRGFTTRFGYAGSWDANGLDATIDTFGLTWNAFRTTSASLSEL